MKGKLPFGCLTVTPFDFPMWRSNNKLHHLVYPFRNVFSLYGHSFINISTNSYALANGSIH